MRRMMWLWLASILTAGGIAGWLFLVAACFVAVALYHERVVAEIAHAQAAVAPTRRRCALVLVRFVGRLLMRLVFHFEADS